MVELYATYVPTSLNPSLLGEEVVDIVDVVERIIQIEAQFGTLPQLEAHLLREFITDGLGAVADTFEQFLRPLGGENRKIDLGNAEVWRHADYAYRHQCAVGLGGLLTEDFTEFLL